MGRNVSGDPGDNFHNTQKTLPWAMSATYLRDVGDETPAADYLPAVANDRENKGVSVASHRFNNNLRYREGEHPNQRQLTPPYILEPIREALGGIELDPCTEPDNPTGADRFYTVDDDGLAQPWDAQRIYCNPPYGKAREPWTRRCIEAASNGAAVVLLIPSHTDTRLVHECFTTAACALFIRGRVKFGVLRKNRRQEAASHPSVLFGWNVQLDIPAIGHTVRLTESKSS